MLLALENGLAGVTLFGPNVAGPEQLSALTAALRAAAPEPVIAIDEEGGDVTRLAHLTGSPYPGNAALGAVDDAPLTPAVYRALGADLAAVGINVDLAPSVDVNTAAGNPVIGTRAFGDRTDLVSLARGRRGHGLQSAGVAACAKHFPGHGSTRDDTHHVLASVEGGLARVRERDLPPFAAAIAAGVAAVMPGHLRVAGLTGGLPATQSAAALGGLLRGELGFTGVIISDGLEMRAVSGLDGDCQRRRPGRRRRRGPALPRPGPGRGGLPRGPGRARRRGHRRRAARRPAGGCGGAGRQVPGGARRRTRCPGGPGDAGAPRARDPGRGAGPGRVAGPGSGR